MGFKWDVPVYIENDHPAGDVFTIKDSDFIDGTTRERPPDFDLHLAIYLMRYEKVPEELINPIEQWVHENKKLVVQRYW